MISRRNRNRRNNRNPNTNRRGRTLARTRNGITQNGAGVSRMDNVRQVRKVQVFDNLSFSNASSDYAYGLMNINLQPKNSPLKELLTQYSSLYEQYRIRRVRIRAQVGKGYTNDERIRTLIGCRVDVDRQLNDVSIANVQSINCAENTVIKTFTERGNVLLADYRPKNRMINTYLPPMLPNSLQYYPIADRVDHRWKGATLTCMIPSPNIQPNSLGITVMTEVEVEFRGRITDPDIFSNLTTFNQTAETPTYDINEPQLDLKNKLLTGSYFPISGFDFNIGNIGTSVTSAEALGCKFRDQSTMKIYEILMWKDDYSDYGANEVLENITISLDPLILT